MYKKYFGIILFIALALLPISKIHAQSNAGFIPRNIWYSKDPFEEGDKIKIYTVIFNSDSREFSGTVVFFDKTVFLGKKEFIAAPKGVEDISINWTASAGDHTIFGKIENAKFLISKGKYEDVYLAGNQTEESLRTVNKKIVIKSEQPTNQKTDMNSVTYGDIVSSIKDVAQNETMKGVVLGVNTVDDLRQNIKTITENKTEKIKKEIKALDIALDKASLVSNKTDNTSYGDKILKPFKYLKLFFFYLTSFIFGNKIVFYSILVAISFFLTRFIWRLFF